MLYLITAGVLSEFMDRSKSASYMNTRLTLELLEAFHLRYKHLKENRHHKYILEPFIINPYSDL
jgi:hypothetical protein